MSALNAGLPCSGSRVCLVRALERSSSAGARLHGRTGPAGRAAAGSAPGVGAGEDSEIMRPREERLCRLGAMSKRHRKRATPEIRWLDPRQRAASVYSWSASTETFLFRLPRIRIQRSKADTLRLHSSNPMILRFGCLQYRHGCKTSITKLR